MNRTTIPRWQVLTSLGAALVFGALHGAATAWLAAPAVVIPDVASPPPVEAHAAAPPAVDEPDPLRGRFWRPAGSDARRPEPDLRPRSWSPAPVIAGPEVHGNPTEEAG